MAKNERYVPFDAESVLGFAAPYLHGVPVSAVEIGDGNLNVVFRVHGESGSVIVKQALPYLRVAGESWPLTRHRARIEAEAIEIHNKLAPGRPAQLLHFDDALSALVLEDLTEHLTWREALIAGQEIADVAESVGRYSAAIILGTSDVILPSRQRRTLKRSFVYSELCLVTEDLVFTAPYIDAESNRYVEGIADRVTELRRDRPLRAAAAELRFSFKTRDEALIHGDLHTGSVMIKPGDTRIIDFEFAFFGPSGFDPGVLLANLALSRLAHRSSGNAAFCRFLDTCALAYWNALVDEMRRRWDPSEPWYHRFLAHLLTDAGRFAGMEMIRRVVGLAHAKDIDILPIDARVEASTHAIDCGRALILGSPVHHFDDLWHRAIGEETR